MIFAALQIGHKHATITPLITRLTMDGLKRDSLFIMHALSILWRATIRQDEGLPSIKTKPRRHSLSLVRAVDTMLPFVLLLLLPVSLFAAPFRYYLVNYFWTIETLPIPLHLSDFWALVDHSSPDNPWGDYASECLADKPWLWDENRIVKVSSHSSRRNAVMMQWEYHNRNKDNDVNGVWLVEILFYYEGEEGITIIENFDCKLCLWNVLRLSFKIL